jgi:hypothetical protein
MALPILTLEVFYKNGGNWPHNMDRVQYGPFITRTDAMEFFAEGVKLGKFNPNHYLIRTINEPSYSATYQES